ncbi:amidase [Minwuia thermotolerans]|uniref:Amidase n=1 Tax=Minwuia thermotolerans TaxID=2056226 RepID=A0A2M9G1R4_9PROT|nr:amidase [Minwuia thermotolerans]PJK29662.1 amidase [Minwuia thermotolerans]
MGDRDLIYLSAGDLVRGYERGDFSPVEVTEAVFRRIDAVDGTLNAFRVLDRDGAMAGARASERRWREGAPLSPVDGVPTTIKDLFDMRGLSTLRGSRTSDTTPAAEDAPTPARLRAAGAVLLGKTNTPEYGWKGVTDSPLTGVTRNPWNTDTTPGGSSGGASAACAAGMGALHLGTDGGGSIRIPAAFAGVFGHKPSFGRVPYYPASPMGTLAHSGPLTRTVADSLLMLNVMMGEDTKDWYSVPSDPIPARVLSGGVEGLRIAYSPDLGHARVDAEVAAAVRAAAEALADLGAEIVETDPGIGDTVEIFNTLWQSGAYGVLRNLPEEKKAELDPGLAGIIGIASGISLGEYMDAMRLRALLGSNMKLFMAGYDALITPSLSVPAFGVDRLVPEGWEEGGNGWVAWTPFSYPFNLTQQPACSVPCGFTDGGLPVGLQIVGRMFDDPTVLRIAAAYEAANPVAASRRPEL